MWLLNDRSFVSLENFPPQCIALLAEYLRNIISWCLIRISMIRCWYDKAGSAIGTSWKWSLMHFLLRGSLIWFTPQRGGLWPRPPVVTRGAGINYWHKHCPVSIDVNTPWLIPAPDNQGNKAAVWMVSLQLTLMADHHPAIRLLIGHLFSVRLSYWLMFVTNLHIPEYQRAIKVWIVPRDDHVAMKQ